MAAPQRPKNERPRSNGPAGLRKPVTTPETRATTKNDIIRKVTRNCIVNAIIKNKRMIEAREKRLGKTKKRKTRTEILAAMDLQDLITERSAMARMGFLDKARELDSMIEVERTRIKKERDEQDQQVLERKMGGLRISHTRRTAAVEAAHASRVSELEQKCAEEVEKLKAKQKREYDALIDETATRATGGVSNCACTDAFKCWHNKSASYNTRRPTKDVIRLRQNGQRLRASGRLQEADDVDNRAAAIESRAEDRWRKTVEESVLSSAWCGGKSSLEQMVERQQATLQALTITHTERMARLKQQYSLQRRNLQSTLAAERKKVILYCRREAVKRRIKDVTEEAKDARNINKHKSDGMQNVSKNMFNDDEENSSSLDSDDDRLEGWKPPAASGMDNSKALSTFEDISSGNVHKKLAEGIFGSEEAGADGLKTSGSRAMDAYRMRQTGATATFDPTREGAQVKMGKFAVQPPPRAPPSAAPPGPGARAKSQKGEYLMEKDDDDDDDDYDDESGDEEDGDNVEDKDSEKSDEKLVRLKTGCSDTGRLRGLSEETYNRSREPISPFSPARGLGGSAEKGFPGFPVPSHRPLASPFSAGGFAISPGISPGGPSMSTAPRGPPMALFESPGGSLPSPLPAMSSSSSPKVPLGTLLGETPTGSNLRGPSMSSPRPPRGLLHSPFPAGGFSASVTRPLGGSSDEPPTNTSVTPQGLPVVPTGPPDGSSFSQLIMGSLGASPKGPLEGSPNGFLMNAPGTPRGLPTGFPGSPRGQMSDLLHPGALGRSSGGPHGEFTAGLPNGTPDSALGSTTGSIGPPREPLPGSLLSGHLGAFPRGRSTRQPDGSPTGLPVNQRGPLSNQFPVESFDAPPGGPSTGLSGESPPGIVSAPCVPPMGSNVPFGGSKPFCSSIGDFGVSGGQPSEWAIGPSPIDPKPPYISTNSPSSAIGVSPRFLSMASDCTHGGPPSSKPHPKENDGPRTGTPMNRQLVNGTTGTVGSEQIQNGRDEKGEEDGEKEKEEDEEGGNEEEDEEGEEEAGEEEGENEDGKEEDPGADDSEEDEPFVNGGENAGAPTIEETDEREVIRCQHEEDSVLDDQRDEGEDEANADYYGEGPISNQDIMLVTASFEDELRSAMPPSKVDVWTNEMNGDNRASGITNIDVSDAGLERATLVVGGTEVEERTARAAGCDPEVSPTRSMVTDTTLSHQQPLDEEEENEGREGEGEEAEETKDEGEVEEDPGGDRSEETEDRLLQQQLLNKEEEEGEEREEDEQGGDEEEDAEDGEEEEDEEEGNKDGEEEDPGADDSEEDESFVDGGENAGAPMIEKTDERGVIPCQYEEDSVLKGQNDEAEHEASADYYGDGPVSKHDNMLVACSFEDELRCAMPSSKVDVWTNEMNGDNRPSGITNIDVSNAERSATAAGCDPEVSPTRFVARYDTLSHQQHLDKEEKNEGREGEEAGETKDEDEEEEDPGGDHSEENEDRLLQQHLLNKEEEEGKEEGEEGKEYEKGGDEEEYEEGGEEEEDEEEGNEDGEEEGPGADDSEENKPFVDGGRNAGAPTTEETDERYVIRCQHEEDSVLKGQKDEHEASTDYYGEGPVSKQDNMLITASFQDELRSPMPPSKVDFWTNEMNGDNRPSGITNIDGSDVGLERAELVVDDTEGGERSARTVGCDPEVSPTRCVATDTTLSHQRHVYEEQENKGREEKEAEKTEDEGEEKKDPGGDHSEETDDRLLQQQFLNKEKEEEEEEEEGGEDGEKGGDEEENEETEDEGKEEDNPGGNHSEENEYRLVQEQLPNKEEGEGEEEGEKGEKDEKEGDEEGGEEGENKDGKEEDPGADDSGEDEPFVDGGENAGTPTLEETNERDTIRCQYEEDSVLDDQKDEGEHEASADYYGDGPVSKQDNMLVTASFEDELRSPMPPSKVDIWTNEMNSDNRPSGIANIDVSDAGLERAALVVGSTEGRERSATGAMCDPEVSPTRSMAAYDTLSYQRHLDKEEENEGREGEEAEEPEGEGEMEEDPGGDHSEENKYRLLQQQLLNKEEEEGKEEGEEGEEDETGGEEEEDEEEGNEDGTEEDPGDDDSKEDKPFVDGGENAGARTIEEIDERYVIRCQHEGDSVLNDQKEEGEHEASTDYYGEGPVSKQDNMLGTASFQDELRSPMHPPKVEVWTNEMNGDNRPSGITNIDGSDAGLEPAELVVDGTDGGERSERAVGCVPEVSPTRCVATDTTLSHQRHLDEEQENGGREEKEAEKTEDEGEKEEDPGGDHSEETDDRLLQQQFLNKEKEEGEEEEEEGEDGGNGGDEEKNEETEDGGKEEDNPGGDHSEENEYRLLQEQLLNKEEKENEEKGEEGEEDEKEGDEEEGEEGENEDGKEKDPGTDDSEEDEPFIDGGENAGAPTLEETDERDVIRCQYEEDSVLDDQKDEGEHEASADYYGDRPVSKQDNMLVTASFEDTLRSPMPPSKVGVWTNEMNSDNRPSGIANIDVSDAGLERAALVVGSTEGRERSATAAVCDPEVSPTGSVATNDTLSHQRHLDKEEKNEGREREEAGETEGEGEMEEDPGGDHSEENKYRLLQQHLLNKGDEEGKEEGEEGEEDEKGGDEEEGAEGGEEEEDEEERNEDGTEENPGADDSGEGEPFVDGGGNAGATTREETDQRYTIRCQHEGDSVLKGQKDEGEHVAGADYYGEGSASKQDNMLATASLEDELRSAMPPSKVDVWTNKMNGDNRPSGITNIDGSDAGLEPAALVVGDAEGGGSSARAAGCDPEVSPTLSVATDTTLPQQQHLDEEQENEGREGKEVEETEDEGEVEENPGGDNSEETEDRLLQQQFLNKEKEEEEEEEEKGEDGENGGDKDEDEEMEDEGKEEENPGSDHPEENEYRLLQQQLLNEEEEEGEEEKKEREKDKKGEEEEEDEERRNEHGMEEDPGADDSEEDEPFVDGGGNAGAPTIEGTDERDVIHCQHEEDGVFNGQKDEGEHEASADYYGEGPVTRQDDMLVTASFEYGLRPAMPSSKVDDSTSTLKRGKSEESINRRQASLKEPRATKDPEERLVRRKTEDGNHKQIGPRAMGEINGGGGTSCLQPCLQIRHISGNEGLGSSLKLKIKPALTLDKSQLKDTGDSQQTSTEGIASEAPVNSLSASRTQDKKGIVRYDMRFTKSQAEVVMTPKSYAETDTNCFFEGAVNLGNPANARSAVDPRLRDRACQTCWSKEVGTQTMPLPNMLD